MAMTHTGSPQRRPWLTRFAGLVVASTCCVSASAADFSATDTLTETWRSTLDWLRGPAPTVVDPERIDLPNQAASPFYGEVLFELYQHHDFNALTDLTLAQRRHQWVAPPEEANLVRANLDLAWGLHRQAAMLYRALPGTESSVMFRDRAWLYLAKARYQRGEFDDANDALRRVGGGLATTDQDQFQELQANLLMVRGKYAEAARLLSPARDDDESTPGLYARYNLGVALIRSGERVRGLETLDELGVDASRRPDELALKDRANLDLGIQALRDHAPDRAQFVLERVRLDGPYAEPALLAYGWAAHQQGKDGTALAAWRRLTDKNTSTPAVIEARLAIPLVLAAAGSPAQALDSYGRALVGFQAQLDRIDGAMTAIRNGAWIDQAADAQDPQVQAPVSEWAVELAPVLASTSVQTVMQGYRDIRFLDRRFAQWADRLQEINLAGDDATRRDALRHRLDEQRQSYVSILAAQKAELTALALAQLQEQKESLQDYGNQARFGVAQLYDESATHPSKNSEPHHVP
jgi:hypothetical protein